MNFEDTGVCSGGGRGLNKTAQPNKTVFLISLTHTHTRVSEDQTFQTDTDLGRLVFNARLSDHTSREHVQHGTDHKEQR